MKTIVITGSTRGIGFGLARSFLESGCNVVISGRSQGAVDLAVDKLTVSFPKDRIFGIPCDIRQPAQVKSLWDQSVARYGSVDIWVNNAGVANPVSEVWQVSYDDIQSVVDTNIKGFFIGSQIAIQEMLSQGFGAIYNLEGLGSEKGRIVPGMSLYGMTKAGLRFFDDTLFKELDGKTVIAGALQPGMVVTDLIGEQNSGNQEQFERVKWITNIIGNRVEDVAPWLVAKMLENTRNGVRFRFMGTMKTTLRFLIAPFRKRDLFSDHS
jgi:NAD(P)-dependent dehydrogenase (short-subunit alcohol dehydrogenase family)